MDLFEYYKKNSIYLPVNLVLNLHWPFGLHLAAIPLYIAALCSVVYEAVGSVFVAYVPVNGNSKVSSISI